MLVKVSSIDQLIIALTFDKRRLEAIFSQRQSQGTPLLFGKNRTLVESL